MNGLEIEKLNQTVVMERANAGALIAERKVPSLILGEVVDGRNKVYSYRKGDGANLYQYVEPGVTTAELEEVLRAVYGPILGIVNRTQERATVTDWITSRRDVQRGEKDMTFTTFNDPDVTLENVIRPDGNRIWRMRSLDFNKRGLRVNFSLRVVPASDS